MTDMKSKNEGKTVWIKCRATEGCDGQQALIVFDKDLNQTDPNGGFNPQGQVVRYKCLTCGKSFHVTR